MSSILSSLNAAAAAIESSETFSKYFTGSHKIGCKYGRHFNSNYSVVESKNSVKFVIKRSSAPRPLKTIISQFNKIPQVYVERTHGRTTSSERVQMAFFGKYISAELIAKKFAVSLPTVYLYTKKLGGMV